MAIMISSSPVSQIPHKYGLFPPSPTPFQQRFQIPSSPPARSHYRPFSSLCTEAPYIEVPDKATRIPKRSSSVGGLHALSSMGLHFKTRKDSPRILPKHSEPATTKVSSKLKTNNVQRPSSSSGLSLSPTSVLHLQKKKSMASLFSTSETLVSVGSEHLTLSTSPVISVFPKANDQPRSPSSKAVSFRESTMLDQDAAEDFVPKNLWAKRYSMRLHLSSIKNVNALDNDRYFELLLQRLSGGSPSFHNYENKPPATVLDLGCGPGYWLLHTADVWKKSQITGLDIVDVTLPLVKSTENLHFLQYNFLLKLPFADNSFEYVRMANLVFCIPYIYWESLLAEVRRILTSNGRLEIIDDQLFFPYGEPPVDRKPLSNRTSSSSSYDTPDESEDIETLHGEDSSDTDSTLFSEAGSNPSSFEDKQPQISQLSESATVRPLTAYLPKTPDYAAPREPAVFNGKPPSIFDPELGESNKEGWRRKAFDARDLENVFEKMLEKDYGISARPSEFVVDMLKNVFGSRAAGKTKSFQIKLAPADSPIGVDAENEEVFLNGNQPSEGNSPILQVGVKKMALVPSESEKQQKKKKDKKERKTVVGTGSTSQRSSLDSELTSTPLPSSLNAKAAERLGLTVHPPPPSPPILDKRKFSPPIRSCSPSPPARSNTPVPTDKEKLPVLSAKAAGRLGISYTALAVATASSARHRPMHAKARHPTQSPGLLVWPSTYIPVDPVELEFHGNKHMHTLLGCKASLSEHVAKCVDESGKRLMDELEFDYALSEYDSFRRTRLNWPESIPDPYDDEPTNTPTYAMPLSIDHTLKQIHARTRPRNSSCSFNGRYGRDELTHIRTVRVFEATKAEDHPLASMFSSRTSSL